ncbi:hypothetical protein PYCC9005_001206 [Savitreella phatthalungensis]
MPRKRDKFEFERPEPAFLKRLKEGELSKQEAEERDREARIGARDKEIEQEEAPTVVDARGEVVDLPRQQRQQQQAQRSVEEKEKENGIEKEQDKRFTAPLTVLKSSAQETKFSLGQKSSRPMKPFAGVAGTNPARNKAVKRAAIKLSFHDDEHDE